MDQKLISTGYHIPYNPKLKERSRELRKNMTEPERKLWFLFLKNQNVTFLRQKPLDEYIVDFYCASQKLVIEIDGDSHYSAEGEKSDLVRTGKLTEYNLTVLRFTNTEVMQNFTEVCEKIATYLESP